MAKVYLDANVLMDITQNRRNRNLTAELENHQVYISVLSIHILFYSYKIKVPNPAAKTSLSNFETIDLSKNILEKALAGPTPDLEDNIQLHSAAAADCDIFLTSDEKLLKMKFFGKAEISPAVSH